MIHFTADTIVGERRIYLNRTTLEVKLFEPTGLTVKPVSFLCQKIAPKV